jgi:phosphoglycerate kinase
MGVITKLLAKVDVIAIGGAMAYTFLQARGESVGKSRVEVERLENAKAILEQAQKHAVTVILPVDHVTAPEFNESAAATTTDTIAIDQMGLDIGPKSRAQIAQALKGAGTVFWNGPMGVFEWERFAAGTMEVCKAVAHCGAYTVVGGGDSVAALNQSGLHKNISHVSTGGGASLELLEGEALPGLSAIGFEF